MPIEIDLTVEERRSAARLLARQLHDISVSASRLGWPALARLASIASAEARRTALVTNFNRQRVGKW